MKFGLFYELQLPRPWTQDAEERLFCETLEQIELADRLGFHSVWLVEHHFLEEYSHSSAPEVFLGAVSQRTRRIRLGHGIVQLPPACNPPARVAERIATLDLLSGGRVEFGTGEGSSQAELGGFGVDRNLKRAQWEEMLDAITRMLVEVPFAGHQGRFLSMPPRSIVPRPQQKPHPPLWVACSRRETILLAARKGLGALSFSFIEPEEAKQWVDDYYRLITGEECVAAGFAVNPNVAVALPMMCHADEQTALDRGLDGAHFFGYALGHYYVFGRHEPGRTHLWKEFEQRRREYGFAPEIVGAAGEPLGIKLLQQGLGSMRGAIGTPVQIAELMARYEQAGVDQVLFVCQAGRNRHEHICESLELFAQAVLPRFAAAEAAREEQKQQRLAEACRRALARRGAPRTPPDGYFLTAAGEPALDRLPVGRLARLLRLSSDQQLEAFFSFRAVQWAVFQGLRRRLNLSRAPGFAGEIQYEFQGRGRSFRWRLQFRDGRVAVRRGGSAAPTLLLRMAPSTFLRLVGGEINAGAALFDRRLEAEGDLGALSSLVRMLT